jgi:hypothetical protein
MQYVKAGAGGGWAQKSVNNVLDSCPGWDQFLVVIGARTKVDLAEKAMHSVRMAGSRRLMMDTRFRAAPDDAFRASNSAGKWTVARIGSAVSYSRSLEFAQRLSHAAGAKWVAWLHGDAELKDPSLLALLALGVCRMMAAGTDKEMQALPLGATAELGQKFGILLTYTDKLSAWGSAGRQASGPADPYIPLYASDHDQYTRMRYAGACFAWLGKMPASYSSHWPAEQVGISHATGATIRAVAEMCLEELWGERLNSCLGVAYFDAKWDFFERLPNQPPPPNLPVCQQPTSKPSAFQEILQARGCDPGTEAALMDGARPSEETLAALVRDPFDRFTRLWLRKMIHTSAAQRIDSNLNAETANSMLEAVREVISGADLPASPHASPESSMSVLAGRKSRLARVEFLDDMPTQLMPGEACGVAGYDGLGPLFPHCLPLESDARVLNTQDRRTTAKVSTSRGLVAVLHRASGESTARTLQSFDAMADRRVVIDASHGGTGAIHIDTALSRAQSDGQTGGRRAKVLDPLTALSMPMALEFARRAGLKADADWVAVTRSGVLLASTPLLRGPVGEMPSVPVTDGLTAVASLLGVIDMAVEAAGDDGFGFLDASCLTVSRAADRSSGGATQLAPACTPEAAGLSNLAGKPDLLFAAHSVPGTGLLVLGRAALEALGPVDIYTGSYSAALADITARISRKGLAGYRVVPANVAVELDKHSTTHCESPERSLAQIHSPVQGRMTIVRLKPRAAGEGCGPLPSSGMPSDGDIALLNDALVAMTEQSYFGASSSGAILSEAAFGERLFGSFGAQVYLPMKWGQWGLPVQVVPWASTMRTPFGSGTSSWLDDAPKPPNHQPHMNSFLGQDSQADVLAMATMAGVPPSMLRKLAQTTQSAVASLRASLLGAIGG